MARSTADLVSRLFDDPPWPAVFRVRGPKARIIPLLKDLESRPDALPWVMNLAGFIADKDLEVRDAAWVTIDRILSSATCEELYGFLMRTTYPIYLPNEWYDLKPADVAGLGRVESALPSIMGLLTFHCDGYVRHEALRNLARVHDGRELPYLLLALNDWVEPICVDASKLIRDRMTPEYEGHFLKALPIALRLFRLKRRDHKEFNRYFLQILLEPRNEAVLAKALRWPNRDTRRQVMWMALELAPKGTPKVVELGLASEDVSLRLSELKALQKCLMGQPLRECLQRLKRDPFMPLRRESILLEAELFPDAAPALWIAALFDRNPSLRALAQIRVRNIPGHSPAEEYRKALKGKSAPSTALFGLGECGEKQDLPLIRAGLESSQPGVRRAAVFGVARLGSEEEVKGLFHMLRDPSLGVVREVQKQLEKWPSCLDAVKLLETFKVDLQRHVRRAILALFAGLGRWEGLIWLTRAATIADGDPQMVDEAHRLIEVSLSISRSNRDFTRPSALQRQELVEIARTIPLPDGMASAILHALG